MKKHLIVAVLLLVVVAMAVGCTAQKRAFSFGGKTAITLPQGQKLVNVTWKSSSLWYLTRPMAEADKVEVYTFQESSSSGWLQGTVTITEVR